MSVIILIDFIVHRQEINVKHKYNNNNGYDIFSLSNDEIVIDFVIRLDQGTKSFVIIV